MYFGFKTVDCVRQTDRQEAAPVAGQIGSSQAGPSPCFPACAASPGAEPGEGGTNNSYCVCAKKLLAKEGEASPGFLSGAKESSCARFSWVLGLKEICP